MDFLMFYNMHEVDCKIALVFDAIHLSLKWPKS